MSYCEDPYKDLSENNKRLKRELSDFIELMRIKISDAAFDKNYSNIKTELIALEDRLNGAGSTAGRPLYPRVGQQFFDTTLNKPIFFSGSAWVDATGTEV